MTTDRVMFRHSSGCGGSPARSAGNKKGQPTMNHEVYLFEHCNGLAVARADAFFKWLDPDQWVSDTGNVEAPTGHVALVQVDRQLIREYVSSAGDPWMSEDRNFAPGWYLVKTNEQGILWAYEYGGWCRLHDAFCADTFE